MMKEQLHPLLRNVSQPSRKDGKPTREWLSIEDSPTREWLSIEDSASPTAAVESIMLTAVIEAHEGQRVYTIQMPEQEEGEE